MTGFSLRPPSRRRLAPAVAALALCLCAAACERGVDQRLERARTLQDLGNVQEAIALLQEVVAEEPEHPEANQLLGAALVRAGRPAQAVAPLQKALADDHHAVPAGLLLASALLASGDRPAAVAAATRVLEKDPRQTAALRLRANVQILTASWAEALADAERILALEPGDENALAVRASSLMKLERLEEAEAAFQELARRGERSGNPRLAGRGCVALAGFYAEGAKQRERAEATYETCLEKYADDPIVVSAAVGFYDQAGKPERASELLRREVEQRPENLDARLRLARRLRAAGQAAEGERLLVEGTELLGTPQPFQVLARFRREAGDSAGALAAVEQAIERSTGSADALRFLQADLLVDIGDHARSEEVALRLELPLYRDMILGRLRLARGDTRGALTAFEAGIRAWPNNAGARYLAGQAAWQLGDRQRALVHFREATRIDAEATDAALDLARAYLEQGGFEEALAFANRHVVHRTSGREEALVIAARSLFELGRPQVARGVLGNWRKQVGPTPAALAELAAFEREERGPAAAAALLEGSGLDLADPANVRALRPLARHLADAGRGAEALKRVEAALGRHPEAGALHEIRGQVLLALGRPQLAQQALERAQALAGDTPGTLAGLGELAARRGEVVEAVRLLDRASALAPGDPEPAYRAARLLLEEGRPADAETRLRALVQVRPRHAGAGVDLARLLADEGRDLGLALELAQRASQLAADDPLALDTLGWVHLRRGEARLAVPALQRAVEASGGTPQAYQRLGEAHEAAGDAQAAVEARRRAEEARARVAGVDKGGSAGR